LAFWSSLKNKDEVSSFITSCFGLKPKNLDLYKVAFTHSSVASARSGNNERLEFLGDSILDSIVAEYLYKNYPHKNEGELTQMKASIVSRDTLNSIGKQLELSKYIKKTRSKQPNRSLDGNTFEALLGALFLDHGYTKTQKVVSKIIEKYVDLNTLEKAEIDYKSKLYQWCQKHKKQLETRFSSYEEKGELFYKATLFIDDRLVGSGTAISKKLAEKLAAENTFTTDALSKVSVKN
jgi:ribonuclease III